MRFIDHTGHIFEQDSYNQMPIGYDLEQNKYIFWVDDELSGKLSIDCYYIKPVRILIDGAVTSASVTRYDIFHSLEMFTPSTTV